MNFVTPHSWLMRATARAVPLALALAAGLPAARGPAAAAAPPAASKAIVAERAAAAAITVDTVAPLAAAGDLAALRALGPEVMAPLAELYRGADVERRAAIAALFYGLGWESKAAEEALFEDLHTDDRNLRLQVQWALGRVSGERAVVRSLLAIMRNDPNALFRDKAACALASDQIHLDERERGELLSGLVAALEDENAQVRRIAAKALQIQTGQKKGYQADADAARR